jgi:thiol-disulfide isomerase/thioredoxin
MMKKNCFIFALVIFISPALFSQSISSIKIQDLLTEIQKNDDTLRVVNLWATWCAPCVKELPYFEKAHQNFKAQKVKIILTAIEDELPKVRAFIQKKNLQAHLLFLDEDQPNHWVPQIEKSWQGEIPITLFVKQGQRKFHSGDFTQEALFAEIQQQLK